MNQDKKKGGGEGKKRNHPVYSVQYLAKNNHKGTWPNTYNKTCRDHGPGLDTKERKAMQKKIDPHKKKYKQFLKKKQKKKKNI